MKNSLFSLRNVVIGTVGGLFLWSNRFRIQQFLESYGIKTPLLKGTVGDTIQSGVAKATGSLKNVVNPNSLDRSLDKKAV